MKRELYIYNEEDFYVGKETVIDSFFDNLDYGVVFEDDGLTGYFYAVNIVDDNFEIIIAVHIYDVESIVDKNIISNIKILWSEDFNKAYLKINNYFHAVIDFENRKAYSRNNFPPANNDEWENLELTDNLLLEL